ncbi:hypothetical protein MKW92_049405 [Papaver armeniacum]|nr:hypothetical protein MKW92_049405 [Papaver armeniacum]
MLLSLFFGFLLGALTIIAVEAFFKSQLVQQDLDPQQSLSFSYNKQVRCDLDIRTGKACCKVGAKDKLPKDQKSKKEIVEVTPVKKHAKIKDHSLIITNSNGSQVTIDLVDCMVLSVSASNLSSRKWAKRYPVKVEGKTSAVYNGSKTFIYILKLPGRRNHGKVNWYAKLNKEFYSYLTSLNAGYPSLKKHPFGFSAEPMDRTTKNDGSTSKSSWLSKKTCKKGFKEYPLTEKTTSSSLDEDPVLSYADFDDKFGFDEGTLCCNLLLSRLFFDAKRNDAIKNNSYRFRSRNSPPNIHGMRFLPMDMNEVWAIELDLEYSVREPGFEKGIINKGLESESVGRATSDLLEGFQSLVSGEITKFSKSSSWKSPYVSKWKSIVNSVANHVSQVPISLGIRIASVRGTLRIHIKPPPSDQLWFGFTSMPDIQFDLDSSVGDHKITSGHVAVILGNRFKAAIRDMLVLPNCEGVCVPWMLAEKDDWIPRKDAPFIWVKQEVVSDPAALELSSCQPKESETIVEEGRKSSDKQASRSNYLEEKDYENAKSLHQRNGQSEELSSSSKPSLSASSSTNQSTSSNRSLQDLKAPLLIKDESHNQTYSYSRSESQEENQSPLSESMIRERQFGSFNEDPNPKKMGSRRARMMDLRNKVSEKFEEKKRHIEEKGRNIVEKMRGP